MRRLATALGVALLGATFTPTPMTAPPVAAAGLETIKIVSYDVKDAVRSGFGCWSHTYTGSIVDTGRMVSGSVSCSPTGNHVADYNGGSGTLNDGVISATNDDNELFFTRNADDGSPIVPVLTLHLAKAAYVEGIRFYGGDLPWNALPGALSAATVEIEGQTYTAATTPFGTPTWDGGPQPNDRLDLEYTIPSWYPTTTIVLRDFAAVMWGGWPSDQFPLTEIAIEGEPATHVAIDVKPGERDPVTVNTSRGQSVPVAILGSASFDVSEVDQSDATMTFGVYGWEISLSLYWKPNGGACGQPTDVNRDGYPDLVCHFVNYALGLDPSLTTLHLNGRTKDGAPFYGADTVVTKR